MALWKAAGNLTTTRAYHTATLLNNGQVLICGGAGDDGQSTFSAELFNPVTATSTATGRMFYPRSSHTATLLPDGRVIVVGGINAIVNSDVFDPQRGEWSPAGPMTLFRISAAAVLMANGRVLVAGGEGLEEGFLASAEEFDPATNTWSAVGSMSVPRSGLTLTTLPDGSVLAVGGINIDGPIDSAELYDPQNRTWSVAGGFFYPRSGHTATALPDGRVLVAGGAPVSAGLSGLNSCEVFDPASGNSYAVGNLNVGRFNHTATSLHNGTVLVSGGYSRHGNVDSPLNSAELFNPASLVWIVTANMSTSRVWHTQTTLQASGVIVQPSHVLVTGGEGATRLASTEIYDSGPAVNR